MSDYTYDDVKRLPLPPKVADEFLAMLVNRFSDAHSLAGLPVKDRIATILSQLESKAISDAAEDYKKSMMYILADSNRERAILALNWPPDMSFKDEVLEMWDEVTSTMTCLDRLLEGWDKYE